MSTGHSEGAVGRFRGPARTAAVALVLAGVSIFATPALINQGIARTSAALVVGFGSIGLAWTRRTSLGLALLMLYLGLLDGYLKLASGSGTVTLVRDVLLYAVVGGVLVRSQIEDRRFAAPPLTGWVIAYVVFVLVQVVNPSRGTLLHSLSGVKPHLEFVPLFFLGYMTVRNTPTLRRFVWLLLVVAAANGIVGYVQFRLTPQQLAGWGPGYSALINGTSQVSARVFVGASGTGHVRPLGLGSDAGAGGLFGVLALGGVFALMSLGVGLRSRLVAALLGTGAIVAIVTSEGRGVIVAGVATVLAYGVMTATSQRRMASLAGLAVAAALSYFVVGSLTAGAGGDAFRYQGLSASKILSTTSSSNGRPGQLKAIATAIAAYPLGAGLGVAGPASSTPGGSPLAGKVDAESEFAFLVDETGVPGLVTVVGFTLVLLGLGLTRVRREPEPHARLLLAAVVSPLAGVLVDFYAGPATVGVPDGPFLWFVGGVIAYWLITSPRESEMRRELLA